MKYLLLASSVLVATMHGAAPDAEEILRKIIMRRSLDDFKSKKEEINKLSREDIFGLQWVCSDYSNALDILHELQEDLYLAQELNSMRTAQIVMPEGKANVFQRLFKYWVAPAAHDRAAEIVRDLNCNDGLRAALDDVAKEIHVPYEQIREKLSSEKKNLDAIFDILQDALDPE